MFLVKLQTCYLQHLQQDLLLRLRKSLYLGIQLDSYFTVLSILVLENVTDDINSTRQLKDQNNATTTVKTRVTITNTTTITQTKLSTSVSTRTTRESKTAENLNENDYLLKYKQKLTSGGVSLLISLSLINLCLALHLLVLS